ncbi:MAG: hypothetical protein IKU25_04510 [Clostridia bacterium]|nr:hypothetical protein [Clostridia bacterium]
MLKALLNKQILEFFSLFTGSGKMGKKSNKKGMTVLYAVVFAYVFGAGGFMMYQIADALCPSLCSVGMGWLFFAIIGLMSVSLSVIFGIFTTQPMLYDAKDNDLLLSFPISASKILFSRMFLLYLQNLIFSLLIFIPAVVVYNSTVGTQPLTLVLQVIVMIILPLLSLVVECVVGWIVAVITSKMRRKNIVTLVLSVALLGAYFYLTTKMTDYMEYITGNAQQLGAKIINAFYPFYQMGRGACGEISSLLVFTGISLVVFAIVYFILSISFIKITTTKKGAKKVKYTGQMLETMSVSSALFKKELNRFFATPMYMLNCGLGVIFHIVIIVFVIVKKDALFEVFSVITVFEHHTLAMLVALTCAVAGMDLVTAPAVSLEGKNIWILQTMPLDSWQVLKAKLKLHLTINLPSSVLCIALTGAFMDVGVVGIITAEAFTIIFVCFCAVIGLICNLKIPNLNWTSEAVVIKQSASVLVSMLVNLGTIFAFGGLYYLLQRFLPAEIIILIFAIVLLAVTAVFTRNLKINGSKKFSYL